MSLSRSLGGLAVLLALSIPVACVEGEHAATAVLPPLSGDVEVAGLSEEVVIRVDTFGLAHVEAKNGTDLFFAQGFNAARDRLWQMDFWRRAGLGELSAVFGKDFIDRDRAARLLLYRGDLDAEWVSYGPEARRAANAFARGVNAYIDFLDAHPERVPLEFVELGYQPGRWSADDAVRIRSHGVWTNAASELDRTLMACSGLSEHDSLRTVLEPAVELPPLPDPNLCRIAPDALEFAALASFPPDLSRQGGSNNWAIAGENTATGRPILASDPHRAYTVPALRYGVHLKAPGLNIIGAGEPHMPGIALGHNGAVAFGFTIFFADLEDLVLLHVDPADRSRYLDGERTRPFERITETLAVAGAESQEVVLEYSVYGPIVWRSRDGALALALKSTAFEPGTAPYYGQLAAMQARTVEAYDEALAHWGSPGEHHVFADQHDIAWRSVAKVPVRPRHRGLYPVVADGAAVWDGFYSSSHLPGGLDEDGILITANNIQRPDVYDYDALNLGYEWVGDWRARRIREVLESSGPATVEASFELQSDTISVFARELVTAISEADLQKQHAISLRTRFINWDKDFSTTSQEAALFQIWYYGQIAPNILKQAGVAEFEDRIILPDERFVLDVLANPSERFWGEDAVLQRDAFLDRTLSRAAFDARLLYFGKGKDERGWGALLTARWKHLAYDRLSRTLRGVFSLAPHPRGGDITTPGFALFDENFDLLYGASWRMVIDVGDWDNSVFVNAPGQSGDPRSPFFKDHYARWFEEQPAPLLYSEEAVRKATAYTIVLRPSPD